MEHVVLIRGGLVEAILAGRKRAEARLSRNRIVPFGCVREGDVLWFRRVGGGYEARAMVVGVASACGLTPAGVRGLRRVHGAAVAASSGFWEARASARYATIVRFERVRAAAAGPVLERKPGDRHAWFVVGGGDREARRAA